jgi:hypothetical protein
MHLEPVFLSFAAEHERLKLRKRRRGMGAPMEDPLACPNLSSCDVHIILGTDSSEDSSRSHGRYAGDSKEVNSAEEHKTESDEEEMLKFRFKDVSVSVSVTTIVHGDDTAECLVNTRIKREAEEKARVKEEERVKAKELADLEATKALVAEINAAMAEAARLEREEEEAAEAKRQAEESEAAAIAERSKAGKRSRPSTATKRVKVSVIDEDAREKELLRKRLAEEEAERLRRLEAERLAAEKVRLARLQALREKIAAECIQRHCRAHLQRKAQRSAATRLQGCVRRWLILKRWWGTVGQVMHAMDFTVVSLQSRYRAQRARTAVQRKRLEACSNNHLREADHWMNTHILDDYRFALGRSFISEGRKGHVIGDPEGTPDPEEVMDVEGDEESLLVSDDDDDDDDDDEGGSEEEEEGSEDEEDYIINQRLNKNKVTPKDAAGMAAFVQRLFDTTSDDSILPSADAPSALCCCSLEELSSRAPPPVSLRGGGQWAAHLMHLLEFLPPPPHCVKPLEVMLRLPLPPAAPVQVDCISEVIVATTTTSHISIAGQGSGTSTPDMSSSTDGPIGDVMSLSEPHIGAVLTSSSIADLKSAAEAAPPIYSMGCAHPSSSSSATL